MTLETLKDNSFKVEGGCVVCREEVASHQNDDNAPRVGRREATLPEAIGAAGRILLEARAPFLYGLSLSTVETARRAARLAAALGGCLDVEGAEEVHPDLLALQSFGLPGATFGELRNRADVVLLWRCDPRPSHPRLFSSPPRTLLSEARDRSMILVPDGQDGASPSVSVLKMPSDVILPVSAGFDLEVILSLRALLAGRVPAGEKVGGVPIADLRVAAERLRGARYAAILWDAKATAGADGFAVASALSLLARDLNRTGRCAARPLGARGNTAGAMAALLGATGYPRAVGFASGAPRFAPGEFDASRMLGEGRADAVLLVGARSSLRPDEAGRAGERAAHDSGTKPKMIVIGPRMPREATDPEIWIPTGLPGLSADGTALRVDGVPVRLRAVLPTGRPTEEEILEALTNEVLVRGKKPHATKSRSATSRTAGTVKLRPHAQDQRRPGR
jgi:formylmethanofuran dehydrogenase subunit B